MALIGAREVLAVAGLVALNVGLAGYDWRLAAIVTGGGIIAVVITSLWAKPQ